MHGVWVSDLAPLILVAAVTVCGIPRYSLVRGVQRRLEGGRGTDPEDAERLRAGGEVADLRRQLDAGGDVTQRVCEPVERLEFVERPLAHQADRAHIEQEG